MPRQNGLKRGVLANLRQEAMRASPCHWTFESTAAILRGSVPDLPFFRPCLALNPFARCAGKLCRLSARVCVAVPRRISRPRTLPFGISCSPGFPEPCGAPP